MRSSHSIRLTFTVQNGAFSLRSARRLHMRAPPGDRRPEIAPAANLVGQWIEIREKGERTVYRRHISPLVTGEVEFPSGTADTPLRRALLQETERVFHLLVPNFEHPSEVVLVEQSLPAKSKTPQRVERFRADISSLDGSDHPEQTR